ncbi:MAG: AbrB/MazE/SpoVT family DNA-binding domain-containing protein [Chloroflexota bacterium]|nr:AbrB/MazE/SpoVT family DNA-binding domain-containing protein [Chloroflexota bacterium]
MKKHLTSVTKKGRITIPAEIRRSLGIKEGDKVAISLSLVSEVKTAQAIIKPVRSVAEMTFGAVAPLKEEVTWEQMRNIAREEHAQVAAHQGL